jgi:hypothetical protein
MNEINQLGRLRIVNHGTKQKPKFVAVGVFSALPCGVLLTGERDAALFDICTVLGQESIRYAGTPADPAFGRTIDDVIRAFPSTLVTAAELENLARIQKAMGELS